MFVVSNVYYMYLLATCKRFSSPLLYNKFEFEQTNTVESMHGSGQASSRSHVNSPHVRRSQDHPLEKVGWMAMPCSESTPWRRH